MDIGLDAASCDETKDNLYLDVLSTEITKTLVYERKALLLAWSVVFIAELDKKTESVWVSITESTHNVGINEHYMCDGKNVYPVMLMWRAIEKCCVSNRLTLYMRKCENSFWNFVKERKGYTVVIDNSSTESVRFCPNYDSQLDREFSRVRGVSVMPFPRRDIGTCHRLRKKRKIVAECASEEEEGGEEEEEGGKEEEEGGKEVECEDDEWDDCVLRGDIGCAARSLMDLTKNMSKAVIRIASPFQPQQHPLPTTHNPPFDAHAQHKAVVTGSLQKHGLVAVGGIPSNSEKSMTPAIAIKDEPVECVFRIKTRRIKTFNLFPFAFTLRLRVVSCMYYNKNAPPSPCIMYIPDSPENRTTLPDGTLGRWAFTSLRQLYSYTAFIVSKPHPCMGVANNARTYIFNNIFYAETNTSVFTNTRAPTKSASDVQYTLRMDERLLSKMIDATIEDACQDMSISEFSCDTSLDDLKDVESSSNEGGTRARATDDYEPTPD